MTLSDGRAVKLDQAAFGDLRALPNRADRGQGDVGLLRRSRQLQPHIRHDDERRGAEGRCSSRRRATTTRRSNGRSTAPNIPVSVYTRLIDGVNKNLPSFHRYLKLRQRMMGARLAALLRSLRAARRRP